MQNETTEETRLDKIAKHFNKYCGLYVTGIVTAATLATNSKDIAINIGYFVNSANKVTVNVIGNGHAGKVVEMLRPNGTTQTFASISEAARVCDISRRKLHRILESGGLNKDTGDLFKIIGAAQSPM